VIETLLPKRFYKKYSHSQEAHQLFLCGGLWELLHSLDIGFHGTNKTLTNNLGLDGVKGSNLTGSFGKGYLD